MTDVDGRPVAVDVYAGDTGDPVRLEGESELHDPNDPSAQTSRTIHKVMRDFQFNVDLDDSLFDTTPPEGYSVGPLTRSWVDRPDEKKDN